MTIASDLLDPYSMRARLQPALFALLPPLVVVFVLFPTAWEPVKVGGAILAAVGGALFLSQFVRDLGRQREPSLFSAWGGKPSLAMLRHRDHRLPPVVKLRYHAALSALMGSPMPTAADEAASPTLADECYEAASRWLVAHSRDSERFRLLFAENISYGFRRNLFAARSMALGSAVLSAGIILSAMTSGWPIEPNSDATAWAGLIAIAAYICVIISIVNQAWVRHAAESYATRLLETAEVLS